MQTSTPIPSIQATPTPKFVKANPTPKPTATAFPIVPVVTKTTLSKMSGLSLEVTLDKTKLEPPVEEVIYLTIDDSPDPSFDSLSQIWRADVENIGEATPVITLTHHHNAFPDGLILSPDSQYLVFGQEYNKRTHMMEIWLFNVNDGHLQAIDRDVTLRVNSQAILWSSDSKSIVYIKVSDDWQSSALHQYFLKTGAVKLLFEQENLINFVGWEYPFIYYLNRDFSGPPHNLHAFNTDTGQVQDILSISGENTTNYIRMSPDGGFALFNYIVVNLQTRIQITELQHPASLWLPDSQGIIEVGLNATKVKRVNSQFVKKLIWEINLPTKDIELIDWSPDGQYLIYRNLQADSYYLLNLTSGQVQEFGVTGALRVGGWASQ